MIFALEWWVYPTIAAIVFGSTVLGMWTGDLLVRRGELTDEEFDEHVRVLVQEEWSRWVGECGAHLGRDWNNRELLCEKAAGHTDPHGLLSDLD